VSEGQHTCRRSRARDYAFSGAVDASELNSRTFDFEPLGVKG
jgi:hypothetical protein